MNTDDLRAAMDELARDVPEPAFTTEVWLQGRRARQRRRWTATVAAAAAVAAIGTATWLTGLLPFSNDDQYLNGNERPFATWPHRSTLASLSVGELTLKNGCIRVGNTPALFPDETRWDPARQELTLDDKTIRIGETAGWSGTSVKANPDTMQIPAACYDDHFKREQTLTTVDYF